MKTRGDDGQVVMVAVISACMQCFLCHVLWSTVSQHQFNITLEESTDCCFAFFGGGGGEGCKVLTGRSVCRAYLLPVAVARFSSGSVASL